MKNQSKKIAIFEGRRVRRIWDEEKEKWYFSVVDIIQVLTQQSDYQAARKYWNKLKERLKKEGNESVTKCLQLKFMASARKS
jgi:DNA-damage-inducible protein D